MDRFERELIASRVYREIEDADKAVMLAIDMQHKLLDIVRLLPQRTELNSLFLDLLKKTDDLINATVRIREEAKKRSKELFKKEGEHEE